MEYGNAGAATVKQVSERVDVFNAVAEINNRINVILNRLVSLNGRVNGYGPECGNDPAQVAPSSLRDRLAAAFPTLGEIESVIGRLDAGLGGDSPNQSKR